MGESFVGVWGSAAILDTFYICAENSSDMSTTLNTNFVETEKSIRYVVAVTAEECENSNHTIDNCGVA